MTRTTKKRTVIAAGILTVAAGLAFFPTVASRDQSTSILHTLSGLCGAIAGALLVFLAMTSERLRRKRFLQLAVILTPGCAIILVSLALLASEHRRLADAFLEAVVYVAYATVVCVILNAFMSRTVKTPDSTDDAPR